MPAREVTFTPEGEDKPVKGNYSMDLKVTYRAADVGGDGSFYRTMQIRPESLGIPFTYTPTFTPASQVNDFQLLGDLTRVGVGFDELSPIMQFVNTTTPRIIGDVGRLKQRIEPNGDLQSGGWTHKTWSLIGRRVTADVEVVYTPVGQGPEKAVRGKGFSVIIGEFDVVGVPVLKFIPDPAVGVPKEIKESIGGIELTNEQQERISWGLPPYFERSELSDLLDKIEEEEGLLRQSQKDSQAKKTAMLRNNELGWINETLKANTYQGVEGLEGLFGESLESQTYRTWLKDGLPSGDSLNALEFPNINLPDPCSGEAWFPAGTLWLPDTPGYQPMATSVGTRFPITSFVAGINGVALQSDRRMRTHCLDMTLKEPAPGVKYYPYAQPDSVLKNLTQITNASRFRGPWDQARIWQYTDMATFKDIGERLFPSISLRQYVDNLLEVSKAGGYEGMDMAKNKQFEPMLLTAVDAKPEALGLVIGKLEEHKKTELSRWLSGGADEMEELIKSGGEGKDHAVLVMNELLTSYQPEIRKGALRYLKRTSAELAINPAALGMVIFSGDNGDALLTLQVAEQHSVTLEKPMLEHLTEKGATSEIKNLAKKLLGNMR
ncbi:MAG: hypothetical protein KDC26_09650 [Armatimonadetes bacterium]|nr:hypothetical protein [Armatimonadota bacterium]